ncbi:MAG: DNA primase [Pyrinomonadaceae bacterium]
MKRQADIVRVIQDYVALKKKGANWMACCPFHKEKTPSFSVNPAKDIFYCFGCSKGGSVFNFVMEIDRVSFPEAIRIVAEKVGMPLPKFEQDDKFEARRKEADEVVEMNAWALEFWEQELENGDAAEVRAVREYIEEREITDETRKLFRLGFAPDSWDALSSYLKRKGATAGQIERSGLVVKKDAGGFYDRFRGRVIFPVMDAQNRPVAFGGRVLPNQGEPKYLNSPETAAYTKGRHLYGLNWARDEIRKKKFAILVEGYLDLIIPFQAGVQNVVASLGTALTEAQAKLLGRFARRVVVNYDGDRAGVQAAKRAIETLLVEEFEVKVLALPDNADPDEFIKKYGLEEYNKRRGEALPHIQFVINQAAREHDLRTPAGKAGAVESVLPFVRAVKSPIQQHEYFDIVMSALRVDETVKKDLWQAWRIEERRAAKENEREQQSQAVQDKIAHAEAVQPTIAERQLLEVLIHDEELRGVIFAQLDEADFTDLPTAGIFRALREIDKAGVEVDFTTLGERTQDDRIASDLVPLFLMGEPPRAAGEALDDVLASAESCVMTLRLMRVERKLKELSGEIAEAERAGDTERRDRLMLESLEWTRRRSELVNRK